MAQQLLDRPQVRAAVEQVRGERVAQGVGEIPPATAACRAHTRRRRRTSEVDSRRPDFERNSAARRRRRPRRARAARARGSARRRAAPPRRPGTMRVFEPLPSTRTSSASKSTEPTSRLTSSSARRPAGVGELEQRAVAQLERRRGRDAVQQRGDLVGAQHARQLRGRLGAGTSSAGFCATTPCSRSVAEKRAQRGELARDGGRDVAPARRAARRSGAAPRGRPPRARRPGPCTTARTGRGRARRRARVLAAIPRRRRSASNSASASRQAGLGCGLSSGAWACSSSTPPPVRSPPSASSSRRASRRRTAAAAAVAAHPGHGRRVDHVVRGPAQAGAGHVHRHARASPSATTMPPCCERGWEEVPIDEIAASGRRRLGPQAM